MRCCAPCCAILSFAGIVLLTFFGFLFDVQPIVMDASVTIADARARRSPCWGAAGIYAATFIVSAGTWLWDSRQRRWKRRMLGGAFVNQELLSINSERGAAPAYGTFVRQSGGDRARV